MKKIFSTIKYVLSMAVFFGVTNYAFAQCPNGSTNVNVAMANETFTGENSWLLWDATAGTALAGVSSNPAAGNACVNTTPSGGWVNGASVDACVVNGNTIELYTYESFGDNWNGGTLSVTTNEDASAYTDGCLANVGGVLYEGGSTADDNDLTAGTGDGGID